MNAPARGSDAAEVVLHWLPLGAGAHVVAWNGRAYEAVCARLQHRARADLFHAALSLRSGGSSYVVEVGPVWGNTSAERGVVVVGPVGLRSLARSRFFRYEVRAWRDGTIPDLAFAVGDPMLMSRDPGRAARLLALVPEVPALTWGRDELDLGEMWNSNSVVAWLLLRSGHDLRDVRPPAGGRAPGWTNGVEFARRGSKMTIKARDWVATILVVAIAVPYVGHLVRDEMPFVEDARGMSGTGAGARQTLVYPGPGAHVQHFVHKD